MDQDCEAEPGQGSDARIAVLEAALAERDALLAEQGAKLAELRAPITLGSRYQPLP